MSLEIEALIRSYDWSSTSLGPIESWSQSLRTSVNIVIQSPVPLVMLWGEDGILIYNDAYSEFAGKRHPQLLGSKVLEGWPEVADFNRNVLDHVLNGKKLSYKDQNLILYRNDVAEEVWMDLNYSPIFDESGKPAGGLAVVVETTQRVIAEQKQKQAEEALRESEEQLRALVTATSDVIYIMNADWSEMGVLEGRVFVSDIGKPRNDWFESNIPDEDKAEVRKVIEHCISSKTTFHMEHKVKLANGNIGWTLSRAIPILDKSGEVIKWFGAATDITEHKQAEDALKESEERFRSLADQSPIIVYMADPNREASMSYFNSAWLTYTGQSFEQAIGIGWTAAIHPDDLAGIFDIYVPAFENKQSYTLPSVRLRQYDGTYRWHLFKGNPRYLPCGEFIGFVGVGIDIHEEKTLLSEMETKNEQLQRTNNDLDNFIYTASHDLKAPVCNIEGLLNGLKDNLESKDYNVDQDTEMILQLMQRSIDRFKNTILDLTEITKAQKTIDGDVHEINLEEIMEDIKLGIYDSIKASNAKIDVDFSEVPSIKFSRKNLKSVIYNLVSNAIKYKCDRQPEIFIKTAKYDQYTLLTVKDNGLGISMQNQEKIFSMFQRFHDHVEGTGVGLYIVKRIIENTGGKIELDSEEGKGSTFKVYFKN